MKLVMGALMALGMGATAWANDDETAAPRRVLSPDEIEALLNLAERLEKLEAASQDTELDKLKKAAEKERQEEMHGLPARISKLEKQADATKPTWDVSKMLSFASPDGNFTAKIGGRIYVVYRHIFDRNDTPANAGGAPDQFILDTARIQLDGTFFKDFFYRLEYASDKNAAAAYNDTFIGWQGLGEHVKLQAGQFKVPWSQEETCSSRFIDFAERSLLNRLAPSRDQGVMLSGSVAEKIFEWSLGAFNGVAKNTADVNDEKDLAIRLMVTPFKAVGGFLKELRLGLDGTHGEMDDVAVAGITDGDLGGITTNPLTAPAGVTLDGIRQRVVGNFSWLYGPVSLRAEYAIVKQEFNDVPAAPKDDFEIRSWYVQATVLLTGETKTLENRIKPESNFNPLNGGWGAIELAGRACLLDTSDAEDAGLVGTATNQKTMQYTVGINWWWTPNVAVRINWEHLRFDEALQNIKRDGDFDQSQDVFYVRWQIDF